MKHTEAYVRARIDVKTKALATKTLDEMGLSVSDAIRSLMIRIANDRCLPFNIQAPNKATQDAIEELESGKAKSFKTIEALVDDLNADN